MVIGLLVIPFGLWGIGDYFGVFGADYAVKVGDTDFIADEPHFIGGTSHAPGTRVQLGVSPAQVKLLAP